MLGAIARLSFAVILAWGALAGLVPPEAAAQWLPSFGRYSRKCATDDEIAVETRRPIDEAALQLAQAVASSDPAEAYSHLTDELRGKQTPKEFATYVRGVQAI